MPSKTKTTAAADKATPPQFQIPAELLGQLVSGPMTQGQAQGLFDQFKKALLEPCLGAEMSHHLGYAPGQAKPEGGAANHRNGKSGKTGALFSNAWADRMSHNFFTTSLSGTGVSIASGGAIVSVI